MKDLGNGVGIDVLTTAKSGSTACTRGEFGVCWVGEGAFEQLQDQETRKISFIPPSAMQIDESLHDPSATWRPNYVGIICENKSLGKNLPR